MERKDTKTAARTFLIGSLLLPSIPIADSGCDLSSGVFLANATLPQVKSCIQSAPDINGRDAGSFTPLHWAARNSSPAVVAALLEAGADIDSRTRGGLTPLHWAAGHNPRPAVVAALLEAGADISIRAQDGSTPLHWAAGRNPRPAVIAALLEAGADIDGARREGLDAAALGGPAQFPGRP